MTSNELRALYTEAVKIVREERKMRLFVFRSNPDKLSEKLAEIDRLLDILAQLKDVAKEHLAELEQPRLLDVPRKAGYE